MYETNANQKDGTHEARTSANVERKPGGGFQGSTASERSAPQEMVQEQRASAPFFVDGQPVEGFSESRATVRQILDRAGKDWESVDVYLLEGPQDVGGKRLGPNQEIEGSKEAPCYLRTEDRSGSERALELSDIKKNAETSRAPQPSGPHERGSPGTSPGDRRK